MATYWVAKNFSKTNNSNYLRRCMSTRKERQFVIALGLVLTLACGLIPNPFLPVSTSITPSPVSSFQFIELFPSEAPTPVSTTIPSSSETVPIGTEVTDSDGHANIQYPDRAVNLTIQVKDNSSSLPLEEIQIQAFLVDNDTKILLIALDFNNEYFPLVKVVDNTVSIKDNTPKMLGVSSAKAQTELAITLSMVKIIEWLNTGKSAVEFFSNIPEIINHSFWHFDYCFTGSQLASYFGFGSGIATALIPTGSKELEEQILEAVFAVSTHVSGQDFESYLHSLPDRYLIRIHRFPNPNFTNPRTIVLSLILIEYLGKCDTPTLTATPMFTDGGRIVFDSPVEGKWQVFSVNPDGSDLRQLTNISKGIGDPAISPNEKLIVFVGDDSKSLYVMNTDGAQIQNVYQTAAEVGWPSWSFDGQKIVFASEVNGYKNLFMMNADGTDTEQLTSVLANDLAPSFSPNGSQIAFSSTRSGAWEIYTINVSNGEIVRLTDLNDPEGQGWPSWSPDGTKIVFESRGNSNSRDIFTMYSDGSQATNITNSPSYEGAPVWSPDGIRIAFASDREGSLDIYIMQGDGSGIIRLTTIWAWGPSWSFHK